MKRRLVPPLPRDGKPAPRVSIGQRFHPPPDPAESYLLVCLMQRRSPGVPPSVYFIVQAVALRRDALTTAIDFLIKSARCRTHALSRQKKARVMTKQRPTLLPTSFSSRRKDQPNRTPDDQELAANGRGYRDFFYARGMSFSSLGVQCRQSVRIVDE